MSHLAEHNGILNPGHYCARPGRLSQDALIHLVSWIKTQWRAGRIVGAIFANVKSAFPSVHHPRMLNTLERFGFHPELINVIHSFLTERKTFLAFKWLQIKSVQAHARSSPGIAPITSTLPPLKQLPLINTQDTNKLRRIRIHG